MRKKITKFGSEAATKKLCMQPTLRRPLKNIIIEVETKSVYRTEIIKYIVDLAINNKATEDTGIVSLITLQHGFLNV